MKIIGLAGKAGCGKDTVAKYLEDTRGYEHLSFAYPIKAALSAMLNINFVYMDRETKEKPIQELGVTPRRLMQTLGTEWGRDLIHPDIWIKALEMNIKGDTVISDVRFPNEAKWIKRHGGMLIYIRRPHTDPVEQHSSETGLSSDHADVSIINNGSISDLYDKVDKALI